MLQPATTQPKQKIRFHSIQTKLTLAIVLILIPVTALLSFLGFRNAQTLLKDRIFEQLETVITARQDRLNELVSNDFSRIRQLTSDSEFALTAESLLLGVSPEAGEQFQNRLEELLARYPEFEGAVFISREGTMSASVGKVDPIARQPESKNEGVAIRENKGSFYVASPLNLGAQQLGTILLQIQAQRIQKIFKDYSGLGITGELILAKREGEQVVFLNQPRNLPNAIQHAINVRQHPRLPVVLAVQQRSGPAIADDYRGVEVVAAFRHFPIPGWGLVAKIDTSEAFAPIETLKLELIQVSTLIMLLFLLVAFLVSRSITEPLQRLHIGTEKIGKGEWDYDLNIHTRDEVEQLADEFSHMAQELKGLYSGLEQKVEERTGELKEAKDEIEKEKAKAETILASIGDGVFVTNKDGKIIFFNRAAEEFTGFTQKEVMGKDAYDIVGMCREENKPIIKEETPTLAALKQGKATRTDMFFYTHKDGRLYPIALVVTPLVIEGSVLGAIVAFRDITREKEVDRMKTEFISVASHQLRTPLSAIKWFTEMLLSGDAGPLVAEQKKFLHQVYGSNERMIELVNALLNVSRIEQGRIGIDPQPTNLTELVNQVLAELTPKIEKKKLHIVVSEHEKLPKISVDPKLIRQVYANLISNAVKYTPEEGEITILISRKGDEIISQITDSGYGIPKEQQERVFSKFFRADNILKVSAEGTGLGLYIVKSVVESSGGKVWFESEEGKGTSFWFTLPVSGTPPRRGERTLEELKY